MYIILITKGRVGTKRSQKESRINIQRLYIICMFNAYIYVCSFLSVLSCAAVLVLLACRMVWATPRLTLNTHTRNLSDSSCSSSSGMLLYMVAAVVVILRSLHTERQIGRQYLGRIMPSMALQLRSAVQTDIQIHRQIGMQIDRQIFRWAVPWLNHAQSHYSPVYGPLITINVCTINRQIDMDMDRLIHTYIDRERQTDRQI